MCQDARKEWSTAVCDSWVAQLGETDNPQSVRADKTATSLLRRLNITSPGFCSRPLPPSVPGALVVPLNASLFQAASHFLTSQSPRPLHPSAFQCPLHICLFCKCCPRLTGHRQSTPGQSSPVAVSRTLH